MERLSLVIPVYNEETHLKEFIDEIHRVELPIERELIFIDDKSSDKSLEILREHSTQFGYRVLEQEKNQGKGAACRRGFKEATGDYVMIQDADFEYNPDDIKELLKPLLNGKADVVYGSRFKKNSPQIHRTYHYMVNRFLTVLSNFFSGIYVTDMETCYKIFRADLLKAMNLKSNRFGIEVELTAYIAKTRARMFELPIEYHPRSYLEGKKITWKDGLAALYHLIRFNFLTNSEEPFKELPSKYRRR